MDVASERSTAVASLSSPRGNVPGRARFLAALGLYLAWLLSLVGLIVWTGSKPPRPGAPDRPASSASADGEAEVVP